MRLGSGFYRSVEAIHGEMHKSGLPGYRGEPDQAWRSDGLERHGYAHQLTRKRGNTMEPIDLKAFGDAGGVLDFGFYFWRPDATLPWTIARIVEEGWLEVFDDDPRGGSQQFSWHGQLLTKTPINFHALALASQAPRLD